MGQHPMQDRVDRSRAALLVVDVQNDFCHHEGSIAARGFDVGPTQRMIPQLIELIEAARRARVPILYTRNEHDEWTDTRAWQGRQAGGTHALCRTGSWGAEFYNIAPAPDERVVVKHRYNSFLGTDLDMILRARGVDSVIFTGVATNICVESTARDAFARGYELVLVEDCLAGSTEEDHRASLSTLERYFGALVTRADELAARWAEGGTQG